ncbi:hypothetical protein [Pontibacter beigongshangensis]|uniref:hypothetical protein n=1 Tax=Pontibacter beigongshangensis TaxID=2574733 RepID=UPI001650541A|nr:hypothetical protein [Pontibacter beigongshangensis]
MDKDIMQGTELVELPLDTKRFQANGTWYNVTDKISTGRMAAYQKLTATYGFGLNTQGFHQMLTQLWAHLQKMEFGACSVLVYNAIEGLTKISDNQVQAFEVCTLFINADGENPRVYDEAAAKKKISDWQEAGIVADFFLMQAAASAVGYRDVYEKLSRTILETGRVLN